MSRLEETLLTQIRLAGLPEPKREVRIIPGRKFRHDLCWDSIKLVVEVQGGTFTVGAHSTGTGIDRDCEKLNLTTINGWRTMAFTGTQIRSGQALRWLQSMFGVEAAA